MAKTVLYNLVRQTKPLPLESNTVTHLEFYSDHPDLFTVEEKRMGVVMNRTAYQNYELNKILAEWEAKGFAQY